MALDLTLFSIPNKAKFVLEKAKLNENYANDFDKIQEINNLKLQLRMIQLMPDGTPENILQELINDSKIVLNYYPEDKIEKYRFQSRTRGYETLKYLLSEYLKYNKIYNTKNKVFFEGTDIINNSQHLLFQYLDNEETKEIYILLKKIDFSDIMKFYDFDKMKNIVYKVIRPENLNHLEVEFEELKDFFYEATKLDALTVIKIC